MALVKCPECGKEVSDKAGKCPNCGFPIESASEKETEKNMVADSEVKQPDSGEDEVKAEKKKVSKKMVAISCIVLAIVIISAIAYFVVTADSRNYDAAQKFYTSEKYKEALDKFTKLGSYKDSKEMVKKCEYALSTDGQFLDALSRGLMKRWEYSEKGYLDEYKKDESELNSTEYVEYLKKCINYELDELKDFGSKTFSDTKLGESAKAYLDILNECLKTTDYYVMDVNQYSLKWNELYAERSVIIRDFVENYGLAVDKEYQKTLEEFIANASVVDEQQAMEQSIQDMMSKFELTSTTDEWEITTYKLTMENTTEYTFDYFYVDINALDANGNIIGTGNISQLTNWTPGQKAEVDAWVNVDDPTLIASVTYTAHYQTGNYFE